MKENIKKMEQKSKEIDKLLQAWDRKIEIDEITSLDKRLLKQFDELWKEVLEITKNENINDMDKFDKKYSIFKYGLYEFVLDYCEVLNDAVDISDEFIDKEIELLKEINQQFILAEDIKNYNELLIIKDTYLLGDEKKAEKEIEKWIEKHPSIGDGYKVKCDWELSKKNPNVNKVTEILDEAQKNKTFVPNEEIYEMIIEYFEEIGEDEKAKHYTSILKAAQEKLYDEFKEEFGIENIRDDFELDFEEEDEFFDDEDDEFFDNEDFEDEDDEYLNEEFDDIDEQIDLLKEKEMLIKEIKSCAKDNVEKNKTIEDYISEKTKQQLTSYLGPQAMFETIENMKKIQKDIKKYILKNYKEVIKNNLIYIPQKVVNQIGNIPFHGIIQKNIEKCTIEQLIEIKDYVLLEQLGMAFMNCKNNILTIHVPIIKNLNEFLGDKEVIRKRKEFQEKTNIIKGICELHGAIKVKKVFQIMNEFYGEISKNDFAKFLILITNISLGIELKINYRNGNLQLIYNSLISEKEAKEIINENKEIIHYSKEEYLKYSNMNFLRDTKGYKRIENELYSKLFLDDVFYEMLDAILMPYIIETRTNGKNVDKIVNIIIEQVKEIENEIGQKNIIDIDEIKKGFKEIAKEFPKWKK